MIRQVPFSLSAVKVVDPIWIGRPLGVNGEILPNDDEAEEALEVNTEPTLGA